MPPNSNLPLLRNQDRPLFFCNLHRLRFYGFWLHFFPHLALRNHLSLPLPSSFSCIFFKLVYFKKNPRMAILTLPLVTSILKPHKHNLSLIFTKSTGNPFTLKHRLFFRRTIGPAVSTNSSVSQESSTDPFSSEQPKKSSVPTFQQAIQRLQVYTVLI